jgi:hypothetical protein
VPEGRQAFGQRARAIRALASEAGAVEVGEDRIDLAQQALDAQAIALALEIGEMPALLHRGERSIRARQGGLGRRERGERGGEVVRHGFQVGQQ